MSIKVKFAFLGLVFLVSLVVLGGVGIFTNNEAERRNSNNSIRRQEVMLLDEIKLDVLKVNLIAMDSIVRKEISAEFREEAEKIKIDVEKHLQTISELDSSSDVKILIELVRENMNVLVSAVLVDLSDLLSGKKQPKDSVQPYAELDDIIDGSAHKINHAVDNTLSLLIQKMNEAEQILVDQFKQSNQIYTITIVLGLLLSGLTLFIFAKSMISGILTLKGVTEKMGEGDFTSKFTLEQKDEIGQLGETIRQVRKQLVETIKGMKSVSSSLSDSSNSMSTVSSQLLSGLEKSKEQASTVAGSTEQMSSNINSMASATEEMNVNVGSVSSAAEEMSVNFDLVAKTIEKMATTIKGIAQDSRKANDISEQAATLSEGASQKMGELNQAGTEIGKVTDMIKKIAEQTNLLALNATIEAASAGEAGKGFSVVAGEIKELASQSSSAAEDITHKIETVQGFTKEAVGFIEKVSEIIKEVNSTVLAISKAMEEQEASTAEVSRNITESNDGVRTIAQSISEIEIGSGDLSKNSGEAAQGANEVSKAIQTMRASTDESTLNSQKVADASTELKKYAEELNGMISRFKIEA